MSIFLVLLLSMLEKDNHLMFQMNTLLGANPANSKILITSKHYIIIPLWIAPYEQHLKKLEKYDFGLSEYVGFKMSISLNCDWNFHCNKFTLWDMTFSM